MYPPDDPFLIYRLFGIFTIRWYAVFILVGALLATWFAARRAAARGHDPEHAWNILALGLITGIAMARAWYVFFEWDRFAAQRDNYDSIWQWLLFDVANPATGGLAIQGAIVGAVLACYIYTRYNGLKVLEWLDIAAPCLPLAQMIGRWGNFFNQEAYGRPMESPQPWGLRIDPQHRIGQYNDLQRYPVETTLFHPTFLYESIWNGLVVVTILVLERRLRGRLRSGDLFMLYVILYSVGRFFIEGLRTDSLCIGAPGGECEAGLRAAQVVALATIAVLGTIIAVRHWRRHRTSPQQSMPE
jgi:phosphatidylglycerol:prolipoprotein diacylglycerol transferase